MPPTPRRHPAVRALLSALIVGACVLAPTGPASADVVVDGAGSTWSQIAVDQWRADVARQGLTVNYQGVGSSAGRVAYYQGQVDFAVSEIPFQSGQDGGADELEAARRRPFAYLPIVAGGTAFMYHLDANGGRVKDLRLSPTTLAKIFTGAITNWNDPAISGENKGRVFPNLPIKVVIRSDGSGTSAQFTSFMASQTPREWSAFCQKAGLGGSCPPTSLYPNPASLGFAAQQFSDGVANFVAAPYNNGAITYVEYGYAKQRGYPVASILNKAGFYIQPTAQAVSIALQGARINPDGTQVLQGVYQFADNRAYPVSSYSYMIVPTTEVSPFSAEEGDTLGKFILYFLCAGQQKAEQLGYSPLPKNLVQVGFDVVKRIPGAPAPPPIGSCSNPTITGNFITGAAPPPPEDDKAAPAEPNSNPGPGGGPTATTAPVAAAGDAGGTGGDVAGGEDPGAVADGATTLPADAGGGEVTEQAAAVDALGGAPINGAAAASSRPVESGAGQESIPAMLYVLVGATVLVGMFGVPALGIYLDRRKGR